MTTAYKRSARLRGEDGTNARACRGRTHTAEDFDAALVAVVAANPQWSGARQRQRALVEMLKTIPAPPV
jgi:hypothetical protein